MKPRHFALYVALLSSLAGCSQREERVAFPKAPVILISIDTLRADHLPAYGYRGVETPAIDALAAEGTVFENAYSHCPMTLPSHLSMLTGLLPTEHGVRNNLGFNFDAAKHESLPSLLRKDGYVTGAAVSSYVLRGETGMRPLFDFYEDSIQPAPGAAFLDYQRSGDVTTRLAGEWTAKNASKPFFLFLHLYEPHVPYAPPEPFRSRYASQPYDGEIAAADAHVGQLVAQLKALGVYDESIVIITSDHGEGLGDHGEEQHSILLYREAIHVPLIVKLPKGEKSGTRSATPVSISDIFTTVLNLTGIEGPARAHAADLFGPGAAERAIYAETIYPYIQLGWSDLRSMIDGKFHFIDGPKPELYDLAKDPRQMKNVIEENRRVAAAMKKSLAGFPAADATPVSVDPEVAAKLGALGYIGSARTRPDPRSLPNPRDVIGVVAEMQEAFALADSGAVDEAATKLRAIAGTHPRLVDVWVKLAEVESEAGRTSDTIAAYEAAIRSSGVFSSEILASLAAAQLDAGRIPQAEESARLALTGSPEKALPVLVRAAIARRDPATAEAFARDAVARRNGAADHLLLAEALKARGDLVAAMTAVDAAAARAGSSSRTFGLEAMRGELLALSNRPTDAIAAYEREIAAFPKNRIAYTRLAVIYFLSQDRAAVKRTIDRMLAANPGPLAKTLAKRTYEAFGM